MKNSPLKYEQLGHPIEWVQYANELFDSSEILYKERDNSIIQKIDTATGKIIIQKSGISRSYFLLIGFSIENLMKAYMISRNPDYLKDGKIDQSISSNHNLFELSRKLKTFDFSKSELNLLKILSEGIPYWTRYPIPKRFENITNEKVLNESTKDNFTKLFCRMELDIYQYVNRGQKLWVDSELDKKIKNYT
jgi:hypothetical protein